MVALVIAEHDNASLKGSTLHTVTAAAQCGGDVHVLVAGSNASGAAAAAAQIAGVSKVIVADAAYFADGLAENIAEQVLALAGSYSHILAPATAYGKNILPRVAAKLDVAQISEITKVDGPDTFERPIYAGNAIATVQSSDRVKVITVRSTGFDAAAASGGSAVTETVAAVADIGKSAFVGRELAKSDRPELTAAKVSLRRPRHGLGRSVQDPRTAGRQAGRRHGRLARRRRRRLRAERLAGRPDRQDRRTDAVHRRRHLRRDTALGRYEGFENHRRHQQRSGSAYLLGGRLRHRGRSVRDRAAAGRRTGLIRSTD